MNIERLYFYHYHMRIVGKENKSNKQIKIQEMTTVQKAGMNSLNKIDSYI